MEHLIIAFYILVFATGFMGFAALLILRLRLRSPYLPRIMGIQLLLLLGLGIVGVFFYTGNIAAEGSRGLRAILGSLSLAVNAALYLIALALIRKIEPVARRRSSLPLAAEILAVLVVLKTLANGVLSLGLGAGTASTGARALLASEAWDLGGYILTGLALAAFGFTLRQADTREESAVIQRLFRGYGLCALAFAPLGFAEYLLNSLDFQPWRPLSLDYLFYLGWNLVSLSAALLGLAPRGDLPSSLDALPEERAKELKLTAREQEMALMIARGLSNKEIAGELGISPATVRTHIYNLYQKVGARSRVELINKLRG